MLVLGIFNSGAIFFARAVGIREGTPAHVAIVLPDDSCAAPCWQGIRPTSMGQAEIEEKLAQLPAVQRLGDGVWVFSPDTVREYSASYFVNTLVLRATHLRLGDLLAALGEPDYQTMQKVLEQPSRNEVMLVRLYYEQKQMILLVSTELDGRLTVNMPLAGVLYPDKYYAQPFYTQRWLGGRWLSDYPPMVMP